MKIKVALPVIALFISLQSYSQNKSALWSLRNLNVSTFTNGDSIPEARSNEEWIKAGKEGKPAWCYYKNDPANDPKFGKLYNWYAVNDIRGLVPKGYHIPTKEEWLSIINFYGGEQAAGHVFKSKEGWDNHGNGNDSINFCVLPGGFRFNLEGEFLYQGKYGMFWTSSLAEDDNAWVFFLCAVDSSATSVYYRKGCGMAVRYIKD